ncbi:MAG: hypothetical protein M0006_03495 [Magnetospirillum sp.]|nr:hypothetical protein [Magnetospirillum sp.]
MNSKLDDVVKDAKSMGFTAQSILTIARQRVRAKNGGRVREPSGEITLLYLDLLEGRVRVGEAGATLQRLVARTEEALTEEGAA